MSGVVPRTGEVSVSCINSVRRCKTNQQSRIVENPNTYFSGSLDFYRRAAAIRGYVQDDEGTKLSEFRGAQVMTACICTITESYGYFYSTCDDGKICICIRPNTINTDGAVRYYGYRLGTTGSFQVCTNNNCKVYSNLQGGGTGNCGCPGGSYRDYVVFMKDNTTKATLSKTVRVTYNANNNLYSCVQGPDGTYGT